MKTFEQYIKETADFRLGGSQRRGFNQKGFKTFDKLEEGDKFYVWVSNDEKEVLEMTFSSTYDDSSDQNHITLETSEDEPFQINRNDFESSVSYGKSKENDWCVATTFDELQETVNRMYRVKIEKENITNWP